MRSKLEPYWVQPSSQVQVSFFMHEDARKDALYTTNLCVLDTGCLLDPPPPPLGALGGLTPLRRGASKLAGNLTMPIGALRTRRAEPTLGFSAAKPG